jgi:hypothetical protein
MKKNLRFGELLLKNEIKRRNQKTALEKKTYYFYKKEKI